jgi:hypothetical protein
MALKASELDNLAVSAWGSVTEVSVPADDTSAPIGVQFGASSDCSSSSLVPGVRSRAGAIASSSLGNAAQINVPLHSRIIDPSKPGGAVFEATLFPLLEIMEDRRAISGKAICAHAPENHQLRKKRRLFCMAN